MATKKQVGAARKNIKKAQAAWQDMSPLARALAQPQGRSRKKPGTGPDSGYYRIEIRPARAFTSFRTQDVGKKGGLERVAGHRTSGSWDTQAWLISKKVAHLSPSGELIIDGAKDRKAIEKAISGKIVRLKSGIFRAHPAKNIPEAAKPTLAMKQAQKKNIRKAQAARSSKKV